MLAANGLPAKGGAYAVTQRLKSTQWWTISFYLVLFAFFAGAALYSARNVINRPWTARNWVGVTTIGNKIYVLGGQNKYGDGERLDEVLEIDLPWRTLDIVTHLPSPCCCVSAVALDGRVYALAGSDGNQYRDEVLEIDPRTRDVHLIGRLPSPRTYGGAAAVSGKLYYIGVGGMEKDAWTRSWRSIP